MSIKTSLSNALSKLGRVGSTALGGNASELDKWLHFYLVDTTAKAYFDRQVKEDMKRIEAIVSANPDASKARDTVFKTTEKSKIGSSALLIQSEQYSLMYQTRAPASSLDKEKLRSLLSSEHGLTGAQVDSLFEKATKTNNPAQIYTVMETGELQPITEV